MPHSDDFLAVHDSAAPAHSPGSATRWWGFAIALLAGLVALCALTWLLSVQRGIAALQQSTAMRADRYAATLESTLDRYEFLPALVSLHPSVRALLASPEDPARIAAVNDYLVEVNRRARASATYVIAANGRALAASNHGEPGSFVGIASGPISRWRRAARSAVSTPSASPATSPATTSRSRSKRPAG
jgi:two-component system C4-dicarboxylate transport sensor histidine kinase DctB